MNLNGLRRRLAHRTVQANAGVAGRCREQATRDAPA